MRTYLPVCLASVLLFGCAGTPRPAGEVPGAAALQAAPTAAMDASASGAAGAVSEPVAVKRRAPAGYRTVTRDGVRLYCKNTVLLGSKLKKDVCLTPEQYEEFEAGSERDRERLRSAASSCRGDAGYGACAG